MKIKHIQVIATGYRYFIDLNDPKIGEFTLDNCEFVA